jgi:SnoaL-like domain
VKARNSRRVDWEAWARRAERALDVANRGDWRGLFAPQATFGDPHTPSTNDLRSISQQTRRIFPDWMQEITRIRGGENWAVFEWIGRGTFSMADAPGTGTRITMHGATIVEVNDQGLVTSWRDYLDRKEPEEQILAAIQAGSAGA